jgi:hypothetical protein
MGSSQSSPLVNDPNRGNNTPPFSQLFESDPVDWNACAQSLEECPEQALLYAHGGVEPSWVWRAIQRGAPEDIIQRLLDCDRDAVDQISHRGGSTLLHLAALQQGGTTTTTSTAPILRIILQRRPGLVAMPDQMGRLPLHRYAGTDPIGASVLLEAFPRGLWKRSKDSGALPLHVALDPPHPPEQEQSISVDYVRVLTSPSSGCTAKMILTRDKRGRTPLDLLLQRLRQNLQDSLWILLQDWIARFFVRPDSPLLHACIEVGGCQTLPMMQRALDDYASDLYRWDALGRSPLHLAGLNGQCDADSLACLMEANPKAPRMTDHEGRLPIDIAAESPDTQPHCLAMLIRGEPRAVNTRDLRNGYYPFLTSALSHQSSLNNTYYLLRSRPEVLSYYHTP